MTMILGVARSDLPHQIMEDFGHWRFPAARSHARAGWPRRADRRRAVHGPSRDRRTRHRAYGALPVGARVPHAMDAIGSEFAARRDVAGACGRNPPVMDDFAVGASRSWSGLARPIVATRACPLCTARGQKYGHTGRQRPSPHQPLPPTQTSPTTFS